MYCTGLLTRPSNGSRASKWESPGMGSRVGCPSLATKQPAARHTWRYGGQVPGMTTSAPDPPPTDAEIRFRRVYEQTYADLLRFVQRRVHPSQAEDVVAETFLVAWRRLDDLPTEARRHSGLAVRDRAAHTAQRAPGARASSGARRPDRRGGIPVAGAGRGRP